MASEATVDEMARAVRDYTGPGLLGAVFVTFATGVNFTQAFTYASRYSEDSAALKLVVVSLMVLVFLDISFSWHTLWVWFVDEVAQPFTVVWSSPITFALRGVGSTMVQFFFAYRIFVMTNRKCYALPAGVAALSLGQLGSAMAATAHASHSSLEDGKDVHTDIWLNLSFGFVCDALLTTTMICLFRKLQHELSPFGTSSRLAKLIRLTVMTNGFGLVAALLTLILSASAPGWWYQPSQVLLLPLYINSLLVSLNSRPRHDRTSTGSNLKHKLCACAGVKVVQTVQVQDEYSNDGSPRTKHPIAHARSESESSSAFDDAEWRLSPALGIVPPAKAVVHRPLRYVGTEKAPSSDGSSATDHNPPGF